MAVYENRYRKKPTGRYNRGNDNNPFSWKIVIRLAIFIGIVVVTYSYHEPIFGKINEIRYKIESWKEERNKQKGYAYRKQQEENKRRRAAQSSSRTTPATPNKSEAIENAPVAAPHSAPITEEPAKPRDNTSQAKPVEAKPADVSKHKLDRFVDQQTGKYGIKDLTTSKVLVDAIYDEIKRPEYGELSTYAIAKKGEVLGVISVTGEVLVPFEYTTIYRWSDRYPNYLLLYKRDYSEEGTKQKRNHLYGLAYMPGGKITVPVEYGSLNMIDFYKERTSLAIAQKGDAYGIITLQNEVKVPFEYYSIKYTGVDNHLSATKRSASSPYSYKTGLIRTTDCKLIIPVEYDDLDVVGPASFIRVKKDGLYGCINDKNQVTVPFQKVNGVGMSQSRTDDKNNRVWFTLPSGEMVCYNSKGERVPCD